MATYACKCGSYSVGNVTWAKLKCPRCGTYVTKKEGSDSMTVPWFSNGNAKIVDMWEGR